LNPALLEMFRFFFVFLCFSFAQTPRLKILNTAGNIAWICFIILIAFFMRKWRAKVALAKN